MVHGLRQPWVNYGVAVGSAAVLLALGSVLGWVIAERPTVGMLGQIAVIIALLVAGFVVTWVWGEARRARGRMEAEAAVRRNLERYLADTLRGMSGCFFSVDGEWRLTFANARAEEVFGKRRGEMEGRLVWEALPRLYASAMAERLRDAMSRRASVQFEMPASASGNRWIEIHAYPSGEGLSIYFHDVSERKRAERAVRESRERMQLVTDSLPAMVAYVGRDQRYQFCNRTYEQWLGKSREQVIGRTVREVLGDETWGRVRRHTEAALAGHTESFEVRLPCVDVGERELSVVQVPHVDEDDGVVQGYIVLALDVTERRRAEADQKRSEQRYRSFVAQSNEGIWRFESEEPTPIDLPEDQQVEGFYEHFYLAECNDAMARMYGFEHADQVIGKAMADLLVRELPGNVELLRAFIRSGYKLMDAESCEPDRHGNPRCFLNNMVGIVEDGRLVRVWGTQRDVTEARQFEAERQALLESERAARAEAERANSAKDEFLAVLSHELRTPLTPVLLTLSMLEARPDLDESVREDLESIRRDVQLEARLIDDLLDLTRITHGKLQLNPETVDVHDLLRRTVAMCRRENGCRIVLQLDADHPFARADAARLQQVFWNLLNNAQKFTPPTGSITVRTRNAEGTRDRATSVQCAGELQELGSMGLASPLGCPMNLIIEVIDTGIGFDAEAGQRLFRAFEQGSKATARRFGGLGLGLAISKALTEASGGQLSAQSEGAGLGATFRVELPTCPASSEADDEAPQEKPAHRRLRILLVEDHESTRAILGRLLETFGHRLTLASSVSEALKSAEAADFDLVISDIGLPDGSGHDLMRALRGRLPGIALSGYGMEEDLRRSAEAGFAEHITKPVDAWKLELAIDRVAQEPGPAASAAPQSQF